MDGYSGASHNAPPARSVTKREPQAVRSLLERQHRRQLRTEATSDMSRKDRRCLYDW